MEAKNGEEAFQRVLEAVTSFELIVTDIQMPICDGFQFTRKVSKIIVGVNTVSNTALYHTF